MAFFCAGGKQVFEFGHEVVDVFELAVDRSEPYVGYVIEFVQLVHDTFAYHRRRDLFFSRLLELPFQFVYELFQGVDTDVAFFTRLLQSRENLVPRKRLPPAVLLNQDDGRLFNPLIRSETSFTTEAFATPAHRVSFLGHPRIDNLIVDAAAIRAFHLVASQILIGLIPAISSSSVAMGSA